MKFACCKMGKPCRPLLLPAALPPTGHKINHRDQRSVWFRWELTSFTVLESGLSVGVIRGPRWECLTLRTFYPPPWDGLRAAWTQCWTKTAFPGNRTTVYRTLSFYRPSSQGKQFVKLYQIEMKLKRSLLGAQKMKSSKWIKTWLGQS
jgi:hypothetical protein